MVRYDGVPTLAYSARVSISSSRIDLTCGISSPLEKYQIEIVKNGGLAPLLRLLQSAFLPLILSAAACVRNVSIHPDNESPIIENGFLYPLIELLGYEDVSSSLSSD